MALKTTAEKADELSVLVPSLSLRLDYLEKKIDSGVKAQNDTNQSVLELREELIHVKRDIADLVKWKDAQNAAQAEKSRRLRL